VAIQTIRLEGAEGVFPGKTADYGLRVDEGCRLQHEEGEHEHKGRRRAHAQ